MRNICIVCQGRRPGRPQRLDERTVRGPRVGSMREGQRSRPEGTDGRTPFTRVRPPSHYGRSVPESIAPILRVADGRPAAEWYARVGVMVTREHWFALDLRLNPGSTEVTA